MSQLVLILDNLRSTANVGSILRTADAVGINMVYCCGTTPYSRLDDDSRDPVVINQNTRQIAKTALGAETTVEIAYKKNTTDAIEVCRKQGRVIYGLEQHSKSLNLLTFSVVLPAALVVGNEVSGIGADVIKLCQQVLEIPQTGKKESLNVSVATGVAVYSILGRTGKL